MYVFFIFYFNQQCLRPSPVPPTLREVHVTREVQAIREALALLSLREVREVRAVRVAQAVEVVRLHCQ